MLNMICLSVIVPLFGLFLVYIICIFLGSKLSPPYIFCFDLNRQVIITNLIIIYWIVYLDSRCLHRVINVLGKA